MTLEKCSYCNIFTFEYPTPAEFENEVACHIVRCEERFREQFEKENPRFVEYMNMALREFQKGEKQGKPVIKKELK